MQPTEYPQSQPPFPSMQEKLESISLTNSGVHAGYRNSTITAEYDTLQNNRREREAPPFPQYQQQPEEKGLSFGNPLTVQAFQFISFVHFTR